MLADCQMLVGGPHGVGKGEISLTTDKGVHGRRGGGAGSQGLEAVGDLSQSVILGVGRLCNPSGQANGITGWMLRKRELKNVERKP